MLVASSFPTAPRKKASCGLTFRLFSNISFNCSKIVYCKIGLMTSTKAGSTPAKSAWGPSVRNSERNVPSVESFFGVGGVSRVGRSDFSEGDWRAVIRVFMTQIGFVIRTVAEPAMAPAIIDSIVVSFFDARPALTAARSKPARVHSYPARTRNVSETCLMEVNPLTVVVDEVRDAYAKECGVKPRIQASDPFSLDYSPNGIVCGGLCSLGFDLCAC